MIGKDVIGPPGFSERPMRAALTLDFPTVAQERREHESRFGGRPLRVLFCHFAGSALNLVVPLPRGGARREELRRKRNFKHLFRCVPRRGKSLPFRSVPANVVQERLGRETCRVLPRRKRDRKSVFFPFRRGFDRHLVPGFVPKNHHGFNSGFYEEPATRSIDRYFAPWADR